MRIVHVSTYDTNGGAGRAAIRLHRGLRQTPGVQSTEMVVNKTANEPGVIALRPLEGLLQTLRRRTERRDRDNRLTAYALTQKPDLEGFDLGRAALGRDLVAQLPPADVINLHWVSGMMDWASFFPAVPRRTPVVWTMHDMSPFTGGCHYDGGCGRFTGACGKCPELGSHHELDVTRWAHDRKRNAIASVPADRLHVVSPSRWLAETAGRSSLLGRFPISHIPYGLETEVFKPRDRAAARGVLELDPSAEVVLFVADSVEKRRKGFGLLIEALAPLSSRPGLHLISVGASAAEVKLPVRHTHLGSITSDWVLATIYSAADVFVIPSLADNLPNTMIESIACGTPVVGFDVGGIPDVVRPGETGMLAPAGDAAALSAAIAGLLDSPRQRLAMSASCRRIAESQYSLAAQANSYLNLYHRMIGPTS